MGCHDVQDPPMYVLSPKVVEGCRHGQPKRRLSTLAVCLELSVTNPFIPFLYRGFDLTRVVKMPYDILNRIYYELTYD